MRRNIVHVVRVGAVVALTLLAACSSDDAPSTTTPAGEVTTTFAGPTATTALGAASTTGAGPTTTALAATSGTGPAPTDAAEDTAPATNAGTTPTLGAINGPAVVDLTTAP